MEVIKETVVSEFAWIIPSILIIVLAFFIDLRMPKQEKKVGALHKGQSFFVYTFKKINIPAVVSSVVPIIMASLAVLDRFPVIVVIVYLVSGSLLLWYCISQYKKHGSTPEQPIDSGISDNSAQKEKDNKNNFLAFIISVLIFVCAITIKIGCQKIDRSGPYIGQVVSFGEYYQSSFAKKEPIDWIVLDLDGDSMLVLSEKCLDCKQFNEELSSNYWDTSSIRQWLQSDFVNTAFSDAEKDKIIPVNTDENTVDTVFLLSVEEADKYFASSKAREAIPTFYAEKHGAGRDSDLYGGPGWWWLRSPGTESNLVADIKSGGAINYEGYDVSSVTFSVRPALWISKSVVKLSQGNCLRKSS